MKKEMWVSIVHTWYKFVSHDPKNDRKWTQQKNIWLFYKNKISPGFITHYLYYIKESTVKKNGSGSCLFSKALCGKSTEQPTHIT